MFFVCTCTLSFTLYMQLTLLIHVNSMTAINTSHPLSPGTWLMIPVIGHQRRLITVILSKLTCDFRNLPPEHNIYPNLFIVSKDVVILPDMIDLMNVCSICSRKTLQNSYTVLCQCCQRKIHRNCITLSHDEFLLIQNCTTWFCKLCNDSIFPFNHIEDDYEFTMTLDQFMNGTLIQRAEFQHPDSMIFDRFEINEDEDQIV